MDTIIEIQSERTVPVGYKHTELGMTPENWDVSPLAKHTLFVGSGKTNTKSKGAFPLFGSTGQIGSCLNPEYEGDAILIARVGANAGKLSFVSGQYGVSDNTIIVKLKPQNNIHFFKYWLIFQNLNSLVFGSGQPLITGTQLKELLLPTPSINEQTAIANVLYDIDALISKIEQLIEKKQAIKTATMQQLLTGRTRLPPFAKHPDGSFKGYKQNEQGVFPEDWSIVSVADVLSEISMGPFGSDIKVSNFTKTGIPVLSGLNVSSSKLVDSFKNFVTEEKAKELKKAVASRGDVIVTHRGTIGQIAYIPDDSIFEKYVISQSQFRARFKKEINPAWLVLYFLSPKGSSSLLEGKGHTGVPAIAQATTTFRKLQFPCPSNEEQAAITTILSDMDAELATLEKKLAKLRDIRQGMMQQLLTGRIRLPLAHQP